MNIQIDRQNDIPRITENGKLVYSEKSDTLYIRTLKEGTKAIGGNTSIVETDPVFTTWLGTNPFSSYLTSATAASTYYPIPVGTTAQYIRGDGSLATFPSIPTVTPAALTKNDDTNVTLTLGGTPGSALLQAVSLSLGWTGTLADSRIASASTWNAKQNAITTGTTAQYLRGDLSLATFPTNVSSFTNDSAYITSSALSPYLTSATAAATYQPIGSYLTTQKGAFGLTLSGTLTTGSKGYVILPYNCTVTKWYITADVSGSIVIDVKKSGVSIVGAGNKPTLSGVSNNSANISGWTTSSLVDGDVLEFNVDSVATVTKVTLTIKITI